MHKQEVVDSIQELSLDELELIIGSGKKNGDGVLWSVSHECNWWTIQFVFTCCS